jgi:tetratricopeptide (TPR) repeat protein
VSVVAWVVAALLVETRDAATPYENLVTRYAAGERATALAELRGWTEKDLARELDRLRAWERTARRCERCPEKEAFARFPLRAAVLFHTDLAELEVRSRTPVDEAVPRCGVSPQAVMAEEIALLALVRPVETGFVGRWFRAMTLRSHADACLADALRWASAGLRWFPEDAPLLLARGTVEETAAALAADAVSTTPGNPAGTGRGLSADQRHYLREALRDFDRALRSDPRLAEARLRRGRVQWLLGQRKEARASFDAVLAESGDASLLVRAWLFRGRGHEEEKRLEDAEADYRAALAFAPQSQAAAVAVSYVSWLQGKTGEAKEVLEQALLRAGRRTAPDPYWDYSFGSDEGATRFMESLREELRP